MPFSSKFETRWIQKQIDESAIKFADSLGKYLCDLQERKGFVRPGHAAMTSSQIRNFFSEIKRIQRNGIEGHVSDFLLIKPKIAYSEARAISKNARSRIKDFRIVMDQAHTAVDITNETDRNARFQRFVDFLEAILAYHKAYGGKD